MKKPLILLLCAAGLSLPLLSHAGEPSLANLTAVESKPAEYFEKRIAIPGWVERISKHRGLMIVLEPGEASCTEKCSKVTLVARMADAASAKLPEPSTHVLLIGKVVVEDDKPVFVADEIITGEEGIRSRVASMAP